MTDQNDSRTYKLNVSNNYLNDAFFEESIILDIVPDYTELWSDELKEKLNNNQFNIV